MSTSTSDLLDRWHLAPFYIPVAFALGLLIRLSLAAIRACEREHGTYRSTVWTLFMGRPHGKLVKDFWQPFILGMIEILTYPVLLRTDNIHIIGAWIGLKTLAQWKAWSENRAHFNRFLIGNALVLIASVLFLEPMVTLTDAKPQNPSAPTSAPSPASTAIVPSVPRRVPPQPLHDVLPEQPPRRAPPR